MFSSYKAVLYFLSLLGPVLFIYQWRTLPIAVLLALALVGFGCAGLVFHLLLVLTKKLLIGHLQISGVHTIHTPEAKRWFLATMLTTIHYQSPFRSMASGLSLIASWYYRGMGARMPDSTLLGMGTLLFDPWFLELGENVNVGRGALLLGHMGHGKEIIFGKITIGDGAVVGAESIVLPDVRIGSNATVAAGALVTRGTVIPDGEVWGGVPAKKISQRSPPL